MVQTLEIPHAEGYPPIKVVTHTDYEALAESHTRLVEALERDRHNMNACRALIEGWNPDEPSKDEIAEILASTITNATEALRMARELEGA